MDSGRTRFFDAWGWYSQWPSITETVMLQTSHFVEFTVICNNDLKSVQLRIEVFYLKYYFANS